MIRSCFIMVFAFFTYHFSFSQYTITWATQQPAWVFPIWFENGDGQRDTIYLGYDVDAKMTFHSVLDTIYGEKRQPVDTSIFTAALSFCCDGIPDTATKANVSGEGIGPGGSISFNKGLLPLKVSWDVSLLHSAALPYPDQSPAPRAEMRMGFYTPMYSLNKDGSWCSAVMSVLITDTIINNGGIAKCIRKDSIYFESMYGPGFSPSDIEVGIRKWEGQIVGIAFNGIDPLQPLIYPVPFADALNIECVSGEKYNYQLIDIFEKILLTESHLIGSIKIPTAHLPAGIYFLSVKYGEKTISKKLIKI